MVNASRNRINNFICCKYARYICEKLYANAILNILSTGAQCNGVCECPNANGRESCGKIINLNDVSSCMRHSFLFAWNV